MSNDTKVFATIFEGKKITFLWTLLDLFSNKMFYFISKAL